MPAPDAAGLAPLRASLRSAGAGATLLQPVAAPVASPATALRPALAVPLRLALAPSPSGRADVRLRLVEARLGSARETGGGAGPPLPPAAATALDAAAKAGALLYLRLAAPGDAGARVLRGLAAMGAARAALPPGARAAVARASRRAADSAPARASAAVAASLDWVDQFIPPSLALASAGALLALVHPPSAAALRAAAAAAPVAAAYAATARAHARGDLRAGDDLEAAWRVVHRRAALALAPHLGDAPASPPLAWALDAYDAVSSAAGGAAGVAALPLDGAAPLALSIGLPSRRRRKRADAEGGAAPAAAPPKRAPSPPASPRWAAALALAPPPSATLLYGAADHVQPVLPPGERVALAGRALYLATVFLPFLLLAPLLLAAAAATPRPAPARAALRSAAWGLLLAGVRAAGPAFIKWAQWTATRDDGLCPPDLCAALATLHDAAPTHGWAHTRAALETAFGRGAVERQFSSFERTPLASGSVAQVHAATLAASGARVAVKVRHPHVAVRVRRDFALLKPLAAAAARAPLLGGGGGGGAGAGADVEASLAQFSASMTAQADLRVEAAHLARFRANFAAVPAVALPAPIAATEGVLVETYERGASVARYMARPAPFNPQIVAAGVDAYLKMLLSDGFIHTDLHPGNILVRVAGAGGSGADGDARLAAAEGAADSEGVARRLQIVLLDAGLAEQLTPPVRLRFVSLITAILRGDGVAGARHLLSFAADQTCPDPAAFEASIVALFADVADIAAPGGIDLDVVLKRVLREVRVHRVRFDSSYAALLVGLVVLVGFAKSLDPTSNLADAAAPAMLAYNLTGRALGRLFA